jgi:uncharacterized protein YkwD
MDNAISAQRLHLMEALDQTRALGAMRGCCFAALALALICIYYPAEASEQLETLRSEALAMVNESRRQEGLPPVQMDEALTQAHAEDMLRKGYFAHIAPTGQTVRDRYRAYGGTAAYVAENIAQCRNCRPDREQLERLHQGWMKSPGHRANILAPGIQSFGFGLAAGDSSMYAVQTFAGSGVPSGAQQDKPLDPAGQLALALHLINHERQSAAVAAFEGSEALSQALTTTVDQPDLQSEDLPPVESVLQALPPEQGRFGRAALIAGQCEACGTQPTDADVRMFVDRWLHDPQYRAILLDPSRSHLGFAMKADGAGRKLALAFIASRH